MTVEAQFLLRKNLHDVCRLQKRQAVGFIVLSFSELICISWLCRVSESHPVDIQKLVVAAKRMASKRHDHEDTESD